MQLRLIHCSSSAHGYLFHNWGNVNADSLLLDFEVCAIECDDSEGRVMFDTQEAFFKWMRYAT